MICWNQDFENRALMKFQFCRQLASKKFPLSDAHRYDLDQKAQIATSTRCKTRFL